MKRPRIEAFEKELDGLSPSPWYDENSGTICVKLRANPIWESPKISPTREKSFFENERDGLFALMARDRIPELIAWIKHLESQSNSDED